MVSAVFEQRLEVKEKLEKITEMGAFWQDEYGTPITDLDGDFSRIN